MALRFGWVPDDWRDTIWKGDQALADVPASSLEDWEKDGDANHLLPFVGKGQEPTVFRFKALSFTETQYVRGLLSGAGMSGVLMAFAAAFRIGVQFPGAPEEQQRSDTGQGGLRTIVRVDGIKMLAEPFCAALERAYPGITFFYGNLIWTASVPSEPEKKASSPQPTLMQSLAEAPTKAATAETPNQAAAGA